MNPERAAQMKAADAAAKAADAAWKQFSVLAYLVMGKSITVENANQRLATLGGIDKARECRRVRVEAHKASSLVHFGNSSADLPQWEIEDMDLVISDLLNL